MLYCPSCASSLDDDSNFCKNCGTKLKEIINLDIINTISMKNYNINIPKITSYHDFLQILSRHNMIPQDTSVIKTLSLSIYENNRQFQFNYPSILSNHILDSELFKDKTEVYLSYVEPQERYRDYYNPYDFVCLYGCPNSKKNKEKINTKKEVLNINSL